MNPIMGSFCSCLYRDRINSHTKLDETKILNVEFLKFMASYGGIELYDSGLSKKFWKIKMEPSGKVIRFRNFHPFNKKFATSCWIHYPKTKNCIHLKGTFVGNFYYDLKVWKNQKEGKRKIGTAYLFVDGDLVGTYKVLPIQKSTQ